MRQITTLTLALVGLIFLTSFLSNPTRVCPHKTDGNFNDSIVISDFEDLSVIIYRKNGYNYFIGQKQKGKYWTKPFLEENMGQIDNFQITRQIINNKKTNNIIINYNFNGHHLYNGHGGWTVSYDALKIWDLNNRQEIFNAVTNWNSEDEMTKTDSTGEEVEDYINICSYRYDLSIKMDGSIIISKLIQNYEGECSVKTDNIECIYAYKNKKYILKK